MRQVLLFGPTHQNVASSASARKLSMCHHRHELGSLFSITQGPAHAEASRSRIEPRLRFSIVSSHRRRRGVGGLQLLRSPLGGTLRGLTRYDALIGEQSPRNAAIGSPMPGKGSPLANAISPSCTASRKRARSSSSDGSQRFVLKFSMIPDACAQPARGLHRRFARSGRESLGGHAATGHMTDPRSDAYVVQMHRHARHDAARTYVSSRSEPGRPTGNTSFVQRAAPELSANSRRKSPRLRPRTLAYTRSTCATAASNPPRPPRS